MYLTNVGLLPLNTLRSEIWEWLIILWDFLCRKIFAFDPDSKRLAIMQRLMRVAGVECIATTNCSFLEVSVVNHDVGCSTVY